MNNINKKTIFICIILVIIFSFFIFYINNKGIFDKERNENYKNYTKIERYEANQYIPVYVTESDVVKKYFNDYKNNMIYNTLEAYNMLNNEYREKRFGNYDNYKEYVDEITSSSMYSMEVDKYSVTVINGKKIFNIYDNSGYQYLIKENSIMDFEVYLDENTVSIE